MVRPLKNTNAVLQLSEAVGRFFDSNWSVEANQDHLFIIVWGQQTFTTQLLAFCFKHRHFSVCGISADLFQFYYVWCYFTVFPQNNVTTGYSEHPFLFLWFRLLRLCSSEDWEQKYEWDSFHSRWRGKPTSGGVFKLYQSCCFKKFCMLLSLYGNSLLLWGTVWPRWVHDRNPRWKK